MTVSKNSDSPMLHLSRRVAKDAYESFWDLLRLPRRGSKGRLRELLGLLELAIASYIPVASPVCVHLSRPVARGALMGWQDGPALGGTWVSISQAFSLACALGV